MKKSSYITREELATFKTELVGEIKAAIAEAMKAHTPKSARGTSAPAVEAKPEYTVVGFTRKGKVLTAKARLLAPAYKALVAKARELQADVIVGVNKDKHLAMTFASIEGAKVALASLNELEGKKSFAKMVDKHYASKARK